jgi:hypothetical protein
MSDGPDVLVLYYSQTGRTKDVLDVFVRPLKEAPNVNVHEVQISPQAPFPYPWPLLRVLSIFPEVVLEEPIPLQPLTFDENRKYDLIVIGCQVWFLSCSLPISSLFHSPKSKVFAETPVVPLLTFRKAWAQGLQCLEGHINRLGGRVIGKIVIRAEDKMPFPLLRAMKYGPRPDGDKEWRYDEQQLDRVERVGQRFATMLHELRAAPRESPGDAASGVLVPEKKQRAAMTTEELLIDKYEETQKRNYLRWGRFIRQRSRPGSARRSLYTVLLLPAFVPVIYWTVPFVILDRWLRGWAGRQSRNE